MTRFRRRDHRRGGTRAHATYSALFGQGSPYETGCLTSGRSPWGPTQYKVNKHTDVNRQSKTL
jgi:hypothetical protein